MAINDSTKLDIIWKKVTFGVTETTEDKAGANEAISSPPMILSSDVYTQSDNIPKPAPVASTSVVFAHIGVERVECIEDISVAGSKTWLTVVDTGLGREDEISPGVSNALTDWLPPSIDSSYLVKVYAGDPETTGIALNPTSTGKEWIFDYSAGVLHFPNALPSGVTANGIYIEGFRYVGIKGVGSTAGTETPFEHITAELADGETEEFTLSTGEYITIYDTILDFPCTIIAHSTPARDDTNPYTFKAIGGRLFDDGSFVQGGKRFFGPRYVTLASRDGTGKTYWSITNQSGAPEEITLNLTITKF